MTGTTAIGSTMPAPSYQRHQRSAIARQPGKAESVYNGNMDISQIPPVFDSHLHIIDPRFTLVANNGYTPPDFSCDDYWQRVAPLRVIGGAVVSGSFQGFDQDYLLAALATLGPGFAGVTQLPASVSDEQILELDRRGVRALRFNLKRGGSEDIKHLDRLASRVYEIARWHVELYVDSSQLQQLYPSLVKLRAFSIDHMGLSRSGWSQLLKLVEHGARVKATGFSRGDLNIPEAISQIVAINNKALMFGSDLPCTRAPRAFGEQDIDTLYHAVDSSIIKRIFADNALEFYRIDN